MKPTFSVSVQIRELVSAESPIWSPLGTWAIPSWSNFYLDIYIERAAAAHARRPNVMVRARPFGTPRRSCGQAHPAARSTHCPNSAKSIMGNRTRAREGALACLLLLLTVRGPRIVGAAEEGGEGRGAPWAGDMHPSLGLQEVQRILSARLLTA